MYGTNDGGHLGSSVGNGALSRCPRLTANWKKPFSAQYLKCHVLVTGPRAGQELGYDFGPNPGDRRSRPDGAAEGSKDFFGGVAPLAQRPAKGHIVRNQIVDVHTRPSRLKSADGAQGGQIDLGIDAGGLGRLVSEVVTDLLQ